MPDMPNLAYACPLMRALQARCVLAVQLQADRDAFVITRPNVGRIQRRLKRGELFNKYKYAAGRFTAQLSYATLVPTCLITKYALLTCPTLLE